MILTRFSPRQIELLFAMEKKGRLTAREQTVYSPFAFYLNIGMLKQYGLVYEDGIGADNRKFWILTDRGRRFLEKLSELEEVLKYGEKSFLASKSK